MKKKKSAKTKTPTPEYDPKRAQNVILEKIYSEIKTINEGYSALSEKVNGMDKTLRGLDSNSFKTEMGIQAIKSQTGTIDIKTDRIEKELDTVKMAVMENSREVKANSPKIDDLNIKVDRVEKKVDTVTTGHEQRIQKLEAVR